MTDLPENSRRASTFWPILIGMVLLALVLVQFKSIAALRGELAALKQQSPSVSASPTSGKNAPVTSHSIRMESPVIIQGQANGDLESRLQSLEQNLASLNKNAQHLMDRGQVPPNDEKAAEWKNFFAGADLGTDTRKLIGTVRLLRSNNLFDDTMAAHAATLLTQSTNSGVTRALIESLRGVKNETLKPAFLALASDSKDGRIRWNAVNALREFAERIPAKAPLKISTDSSGESVGELRKLASLPLTDERQADSKSWAINTGLTLTNVGPRSVS